MVTCDMHDPIVEIYLPKLSNFEFNRFSSFFSFRTSQVIPSADELDCSLEQYAKIVCSMFDIPVYETNSDSSKKSDNQLIQSLHVLFSTYAQFKQLDFNQNDDQSKDGLTSNNSTINNQHNQQQPKNKTMKNSDVMTFN